MLSRVVLLCFLQGAFGQSQPLESSVSLAIAPAPAPSGVSAHSKKKIAVVLDTLQDIRQSIANEERGETAIYNKYMQWCKSEKTGIARDLSETRSELKNAQVLSQERISNIESYKAFVEKTGKEIQEAKDAVDQAVALRTSEHAKYTEEMQINTQSISQIDAALKHVGKVKQQGGFLQDGILKKLQLNQPGESAYVLGVMKGLKDKLEKSRALMKSTEEEKSQMHNAFIDTKGKSLKSMTSTLTEKKILLTETQAKLTGVQQKIAKLTEEVDTLQEKAGKTRQTCDTTESEWKQRQEDRVKEKAALNEAIRYLTESALNQVSFLQLSAEGRNDEALPVSFLQAGATSELREARLLNLLKTNTDEVENRVQKHDFNGVKNVVQKLIGSHRDTQAEEKEKKEYCEKELSIKSDEKATITDALAAVKASIGKKVAEAAMLKDEVAKLYESKAQLRKSLDEAGKVRKQQVAMYLSGSKDRAIAIKVLSQAKAVLQSFYDQQNLLQSAAAPAPAPGRAAPAKWKSDSPRKKAASFGAVSLIQGIADDIAKEEKDAAIQERQAAEAYSQLQQDTQRSADDKQQDITERMISKAKLSIQINTLKETQTAKADDLSAVNKQLAALHNSCDELLKFFDKRTESRSFEVSQLTGVMDILSAGSEMAVQSGFAGIQ